MARNFRKYPPPIDRLLDKLIRIPTTGCWEWQGANQAYGYGHMKLKGRSIRTHRFSYELFCGPIPDGVFVCHRCDNPPCCNPTHLFLGTNDDNMADMVAKCRLPRGIEHHASKLTPEQVDEIRQLYSSAPDSKRRRTGLGCWRLSRRFGVARSTIEDIVSGKTWRWR